MIQAEQFNEEQIELIKSHMFDDLNILKDVTIRSDKTFCEDCKQLIRVKNIRKKNGKNYCFNCYMKQVHTIPYVNYESAVDLSDTKNLPKLILDHTKQPITGHQPITDVGVVKTINLLEGLTDEQKTIIKYFVNKGCHPLGFKVYLDSDDISYFGLNLAELLKAYNWRVK